MKKILGFLFLGVSAVLSLTFASYIVLTKFQPEVELRRMLIAMSELDTVRQNSALSWTRDLEERVNTTIYTSGQLNLENIAEVEHGTRFRVVQLTRAKDYADLSGEVRALGDRTYLTYEAPGPDVPGVDFSGEDVWVEFFTGDLPGWGSILPGITVPVFGGERQGSWSPEAIAKLRKLLRVADVFLVSYDNETDDVREVETRILDARFDPDAVRAFLRELIRIKHDREPSANELLHIEAQALALEKLTIRLWIGKEDHLLYRFQAAGAIPEEGASTLVPVDILVDFSGFNEPFAVEIPNEKDVLTFKEILGATFGLLPESDESSALSLRPANQPLVTSDVAHLPVSEVEQSTDPDRDGLDNVLERFYGTNPQNPDTDGDGVSDGEEVLSGRNPRGDGSLFGFGLR